MKNLMRFFCIVLICFVFTSFILQQVTFESPATPNANAGFSSLMSGRMAFVTRIFSEYFVNQTSYKTLFLAVLYFAIFAVCIRMQTFHRQFLRRFSVKTIRFSNKTTTERESDD